MRTELTMNEMAMVNGGDAVKMLVDGVEYAWDETKNCFVKVWDKTKDGAEYVWDKTKEIASSVWNTITSWF